MIKSLLLFFTVFFLSMTIYADNVLLLTKPKSGETDVFHKGSYLVFELKADGSMQEGYIRDIKDSSLVFDNSQVSLSQIIIYAGNTKGKIEAGKVANAVGNTLLIAGTTVFNCGLDLILYNDYYYWPVGGTIWLAGAFIAGLGYAFDLATYPFDHSVRVRNYREWNACIIKEEEEKQVAGDKDFKSDSFEIINPAAEQEPKKKRARKIAGDDVYGD